MTSAANDPVDGAAAAADERLPFLFACLAPFAPFLERKDVTDIYVNRPGEIWLETCGGATKRCPFDITDEQLLRLARQVAALTHQGISREHPLLAARLPDGSRVQIIAPPATRGPVALAIRKHQLSDMSLADYALSGAFCDLTDGVGEPAELTHSASAEPTAYLREAVRQRRTIVIAGGTSTGKTSFLNALLREVPCHERLIVIEDTPELIIRQDNAIGLIVAKGPLGEANVTMEDLVQASLRMRPDRIILGELRGVEAYSFLRAVNTGHPGSMTTIHANDPKGAVEQLALLVQAGSTLRRADVIEYVRHVVDLFVQLDRRDGSRSITQIIDSRGLIV